MGFILFKKSKMRYAIEEGNTARIGQLVDAGLDVNSRDDYGRSFLQYAVVFGNPDTVKELIKRGAVVDLSAPFGKSVAHMAAEQGSVEIMTQLLDANPDLLNRRNFKGDTPLHVAARKGYADVADLLLKRGADPALKNFENRTAYFLAQQERHQEVADLLKPPLPPEPLKPLPVYSGWKKLGDEKIALVLNESAIGYRLTEVFNFKTGERTRIYHNLETRTDAVETKDFDEIADMQPVEEALRQLNVKMGGKADPASIRRISKRKSI